MHFQIIQFRDLKVTAKSINRALLSHSKVTATIGCTRETKQFMLKCQLRLNDITENFLINSISEDK